MSPMRTCILRSALVLTASMLFWACESEVPGGEITVRNSLGGPYSTLYVSGGGSRYKLESQDYAVLSQGTREIRFEYFDGKQKHLYRVVCPKTLNERITIKLIDVHVNRIAGGCQSVPVQ